MVGSVFVRLKFRQSLGNSDQFDLLLLKVQLEEFGPVGVDRPVGQYVGL